MVPMKLSLEHFISESISVGFASPPPHPKSPPCPNRFNWRDQDFKITACVREWHDFERRGRMARNMQPQHAEVASKRGSWGVGRFFFEVQTESGQYFKLYYDRAPKDAFDREGHWVLLAEMAPDEAPKNL